MSDESVTMLVNAGILALTALLMMFINPKANARLLKFFTYWALVISLVGAVFCVGYVVIGEYL